MKPSFSSPSSASVPAAGTLIRDTQGVLATITEVLERKDDSPMMVLQTKEGSEYRLPLEFADQKEGNYYVRVAFSEWRAGGKGKEQTSSGIDHPGASSIPVWEEVATVEKKVADTGKGVRIGKKVKERQETVPVSLLQEEIEVERIPINRILASNEVPRPRQEGDTYIVPVFKEVLVIEKKLCLEEEVHITTHKKEVASSQAVSLRSEEISIQRFDEGAQ